MKKITLALVTALALASQVTPAQAAQKTPYCPSKDKVNAEIVNLYKSNKGVKKDRKKLIYLNEKTYNALKAKKQWKKLKAMQTVRYSVELSYGEDAAKKLKLDCSFKENKKVSKKNKARYQITLTVSDDAAYKAYKNQQQQTSTPTPDPTPNPSTPTQPTQEPSTPVYEEEETLLEASCGKEYARKIVTEVGERINDYERWYDCTANDFEKASIIAGWVDEHMSYCAQGDYPEDCGDLLQGTALGDCTAFATLNERIAEHFNIDVTTCQKPGHIWNILTVDGVRYEYDVTDSGTNGTYFEEISHGRYAKYNVREFGGSVASITEKECRRGSYYYAKMNYTRDYAIRDYYVKGTYYSCNKVFWVTDLSKEKGFFYDEAAETKYYYKDYDSVTQVLEKITDNEIQRYYEEWINTPD